MKHDKSIRLWGTRLTAFFVALLLFVYVNYENTNSISSTNPSGSASITTVEVLNEVPIDINIDRDRFYVSGVPESATVQLSGPQSLITQTLATQNMVVQTPNLTELGPGTHEIELSIKELSSRLNYRINPNKVTVTIEERVTQTFPLNLKLNENLVMSGYLFGEPQVSHQEVEVTGLSSEIASIHEVLVIVPPGSQPYRESLSLSIPVALFDADGNLVDAAVNPSEVQVTIPVIPNEKIVPYRLQLINEPSNYDIEVSFAGEQSDSITLVAPQNILDDIDSVTIPVDLRGINNTTVIEVEVPVMNGIVDQSDEFVKLQIRVQENNTEDPVEEEDKSTLDPSGNQENNSSEQRDSSESEATSSRTTN